MEFLTVLLAAVLGVLSPAGFVADRLAANAIRQQFDHIEDLAVRIDSTPNYRLLQGRADRVQIAGRGVFPIADVRIDTLEVETDPIALNLSDANDLKQPIQAGVRLVLTREDLNFALRSEPVTDALRDLSLNFLGGTAQQLQRYDFVEPQVQFIAGNSPEAETRVRFQVSLVEQPAEKTAQTPPQNNRIEITGETGLQILAGKQLSLVNPEIRINNEAVPPELVNLLLGGISQQLDLGNLQGSGIFARILDLQIQDDRLTLAAFVQLQPGFDFSDR
ncbi:DUF2993 domain-containing protein [Leptolyngbya sp. FACHB-711]|uniref:LmeA family phospholipid-binding protein n=1 Tax=unclassified Leptolyngbya TaxID=2650499 RepID=UPI0016869D56|nr:DUF2993 domain-containing protein [Leptolyngbya sp. FACHB-711]MBD2027093.1 DUF2993 domain-containing protein [Leptolyngbya sp. FACHB-711]